MVKRIFTLCAAGNGPKRIATILTKKQVVNPSNALTVIQENLKNQPLPFQFSKR